mgnify:CR=1 FL=1
MGDVLIVAGFDGVARKNGVAVVAVVIEYVLTIGGIPDRIRQKLMLRLCWPVGVLLRVLLV